MIFDTIDIFCHVVDNFGDIGVVYRFAREFKYAHPNCRVRVFVDDLNSLKSMHPEIDTHLTLQEHAGIIYINTLALNRALVEELGTAQILVEAFACYIPEIVLDAASRHRTYIINLDHLSAEKWVEGYHLKESLLGRGELRKYFFMPGFTRDTGGVIIDSHIENVRDRLLKNRRARINDFLRPFGLALENDDDSLIGTVFTYEHRFDSMLESLRTGRKHAYTLVFGRKSIEGMELTLRHKTGERLGDCVYRIDNVIIVFMPFLTQQDYDELLCLSDFNMVRGEDTLVRAILTQKPFLWHAYKQDNNYQQVKVKAFLDAFKVYFEEEGVYNHVRDLFLYMNDSTILQDDELERYDRFLKDLNKIGHATAKMSYFIRNNCNLIKHFTDFLVQLP